jgi:hypothetical protein
MSPTSLYASHLCGLGSHAMQQLKQKVRDGVGLLAVVLGFMLVVACSDPNPPALATPTTAVPDLKPEPKPEPIDGVLEIGTGERPTLSVTAFYDANGNDKRDATEVALEMAGLRLTPVKNVETGLQQTGPGRIVRSSKQGVLVAHVPTGLYRLGFVPVISAGSDPNAGLWVLTEQEVLLGLNTSIDLAAFCQLDAKHIAPVPVGPCAPQYDLKPRAYLGALPEEIRPGETSILRFRTDDEASVTLEPFGEVESFKEFDFFKRLIKPEVTTTYTLRAKNAYDTQEVSVRVVVKP